jgi:ribonuclease BN (tRNA processing enzyme)
MTGNLARIWKEAAVAELLLQHFSGGTEQNHEKISSEIIYVLAKIRNGHLLNTSPRT